MYYTMLIFVECLPSENKTSLLVEICFVSFAVLKVKVKRRIETKVYFAGLLVFITKPLAIKVDMDDQGV